jgi:hypothetical protein
VDDGHILVYALPPQVSVAVFETKMVTYIRLLLELPLKLNKFLRVLNFRNSVWKGLKSMLEKECHDSAF